MRLIEFFKIITEDEGSRDYPNPMPKKINMDHPLFGEWAELQDEVEITLMYQSWKSAGHTEDVPMDRWKELLTKTRQRYGEVITLDPGRLISSEPTLDKSHLDALVKGRKVRTSSAIPVVYRMGRNEIVGDGNHRVAADYVKQQPTTVLYLNLNKLAKAIQQ